MPLAHARLQIDGDDRFGKEIVAGPVAAVFIDGRCLNRQVDEAGLRVGGDLRSYADVAGPLPRPVFPGVVAELARAGDRVESPQLLPCANVEGTHESLRIGR